MPVECPEELHWIYHFTHKNNILGILQNGLLCHNQTPDTVVRIDDEEVQEIREEKEVPVPPNGTVHEYVPFYLGQRVPMINSVYAFQREIYYDCVFITVSADIIGEKNVVFTDGNAACHETSFYKFREQLDRVDLELATSWRRRPDEPNVKRRANAEVLYHQCFPAELIHSFGVHNANVYREIQQIYRKNLDLPRKLINLQPRWYLDRHYEEPDEGEEETN